jgi:hypothetical protein
MKVASAFWRRFVLAYEADPFPAVRMVNAEEPLGEKSPARVACAQWFLGLCDGCASPESIALREALRPDLEKVIETGGMISDELIHFLSEFF